MPYYHVSCLTIAKLKLVYVKFYELLILTTIICWEN